MSPTPPFHLLWCGHCSLCLPISYNHQIHCCCHYCEQIGLGTQSSVTVGHRLSSSEAYGVFPDQGSHQCPGTSSCSFLRISISESPGPSVLTCCPFIPLKPLTKWSCAVLSCFGRVWLFVTPRTVARWDPLSLGILQARILEWDAMPSSRGIFLIQELNPHLSYCGYILYRLNHQESPYSNHSYFNSLSDNSNIPAFSLTNSCFLCFFRLFHLFFFFFFPFSMLNFFVQKNILKTRKLSPLQWCSLVTSVPGSLPPVSCVWLSGWISVLLPVLERKRITVITNLWMHNDLIGGNWLNSSPVVGCFSLWVV